jgi:hypothetical protein
MTHGSHVAQPRPLACELRSTDASCIEPNKLPLAQRESISRFPTCLLALEACNRALRKFHSQKDVRESLLHGYGQSGHMTTSTQEAATAVCSGCSVLRSGRQFVASATAEEAVSQQALVCAAARGWLRGHDVEGRNFEPSVYKTSCPAPQELPHYTTPQLQLQYSTTTHFLLPIYSQTLPSTTLHHVWNDG